MADSGRGEHQLFEIELQLRVHGMCRIAIARAAYNLGDGIVFDDTLSAMDAHVGGEVFEKCFKGLLKDKAVIFATNQLAFCKDCDYIYVLHEGSMVQKGTFAELASQPGQFEAILQHVTGSQADNKVDDKMDSKSDIDIKTDSPVPSATVRSPRSPKRALMIAEDKEHKQEGFAAFFAICK